MFEIRKLQEQAICESVRRESDDETAAVIVYGVDGSAGSEDNATWVRTTMSRLESRFDPETARRIRMACQCRYGMDERIAFIKRLIASASSLEAFGSLEEANAAGLFYQDDVLHLQFRFCPCPMLEGVEKLETDTWCQCTTGYSRDLFEEAYGCKVDVKLLKSIKMGDDVCLMTIIPQDVRSAFMKGSQDDQLSTQGI